MMEKKASRPGTDLLAAVAAWPPLIVVLPGEATLEGVVAFLKQLPHGDTESCGVAELHWRVWAKWTLKRKRLPAPKDAGDSPTIRLRRVLDRFHPNSAEHWAARIELRFLTDDAAHAEAEVARFVGALRVAKLRPDAEYGRKFKEGRTGKPGKTRTLAEGWLRRLPKREDGKRRTNTEAATWISENCHDAEHLTIAAIKKYLPPVRGARKPPEKTS